MVPCENKIILDNLVFYFNTESRLKWNKIILAEPPPSVGRPKIILFHAWFHHEMKWNNFREWAELRGAFNCAGAWCRLKGMLFTVSRPPPAACWRLLWLANAVIGYNTASRIFQHELLKYFISFQTKIKHWSTLKFFKVIWFHFMMEPHLKLNYFRTVDRRRRLGSEML